MDDHTLMLSSGRKLAYAEYGDPAGVPMFFFHGWPGSRLQGEFMQEVGQKLGLRIVSPDRPGIGLSEFQPGRRLLDWPAVIRELADQLGWENFHVLGVSGGGPYVLACAHALPERLLSASVVCGAPPLREVGMQDLMWTYRLALWGQRRLPWLLGAGLAVAGQFMRLPANSPLMALHISKMCPRDQMALHTPKLYRILMANGRVGVGSPVRALSLDGDIYSSDWGIDFVRVLYPIRYWHGGRDINIPASMVERFVAKMPNASLTVLPEEGHYSLPMLCIDKIVGELLSEARAA
jgi:pimeloyl-ACP methyl ester carboxylesterase